MFISNIGILAILAGTSVLANTPPGAKRAESTGISAGTGAEVSINPRAGTGPLRLLIQEYTTCESNGPGELIWTTHGSDQHNLDFNEDWKEEHSKCCFMDGRMERLTLLITLLRRLSPADSVPTETLKIEVPTTSFPATAYPGIETTGIASVVCTVV
ncbi:hypothetical protein IAT40_002377 [Kwoniella sp. CBS 6097]